jgi:hypothetical protein
MISDPKLDLDLHDAKSAMRRLLADAFNNADIENNDTASALKREIYSFMLWLRDEYRRLPKFDDEDEWKKSLEQEYVIKRLKQ